MNSLNLKHDTTQQKNILFLEGFHFGLVKVREASPNYKTRYPVINFLFFYIATWVTIFRMSEKRNCMPEKRFCMTKKS
jgi:hypothetical protein